MSSRGRQNGPFKAPGLQGAENNTSYQQSVPGSLNLTPANVKRPPVRRPK